MIAVTEIHMLKTKNEDAIICGNETIIQNRNDRTKGWVALYIRNDLATKSYNEIK